MTMINRSDPKTSAHTALTKNEINLLNVVVKNKNTPENKETISYYLLKIAKLGGYLARSSDPPPGNTVMWRGLTRLIDIELGFYLAKNYG